MTELFVVVAYIVLAVVFGFLSAHLAFRAFKNHLANNVRVQVPWLALMFGAASAVTLMRLPYRVGQAFNFDAPLIPPDNVAFGALVLIEAVAALGFWFAFRASLNRTEHERRDDISPGGTD